MKELTEIEVAVVSGAGNVEICQAGTAVAGGVIGGVVGFYGGFGFGAGPGASWGTSLGGLVGTVMCGRFFAN